MNDNRVKDHVGVTPKLQTGEVLCKKIKTTLVCVLYLLSKIGAG